MALGWPTMAVVLTCAVAVMLPGVSSTRDRMNVLEVKKRDYKSCNSGRPIHNWTGGYGRDVVPLNVTKTYYFISAKGSFCHRGTKVAIRVN
nr:lamin-like protein [Ipomoea trifida]